MLLSSATTSTLLPKFDLTISISVILALCAILSPILTAIINNIHHTKIRKMELQQDYYRETIFHQRELFENYLKCAGRCIQNSDLDALKDYGEYYFSALPYTAGKLRSDMIKANQLILKEEYKEASPILEEITSMISSTPPMQ